MADNTSIRFISPRATCELVGLSARQISRLVDTGKFPPPVKLGVGRNGRIGFVDAEVEDWQRARIAERDASRAP